MVTGMIVRAHLVAAALVLSVGCGATSAEAPQSAPGPRSATAPEQPAPPSVAEQSVRPGVNDRFLDPKADVELWVKRFEGESREVFSSRAAIVAAMNLKPNAVVADVGAGTGLFVGPLSKAVGDAGKVHAIEISPRFLQHLHQRGKADGWKNVELVKGTDRSVELAAASVDVVFVCDVYHHFEYPKAMLASIHQALRPGGELVIVDFERIPGVSRKWTLDHVRAGKDVVTAEIRAAGFELSQEIKVKGLTENYTLQFRKR